jgi:hypothetical protein
MNENQASAILRRAGVHWPHVSGADIDALAAAADKRTREATKTLLATVPDESEIELVTKTDEATGEVLETKTISNPKPMHARLGFATKSELDSKRSSISLAEELSEEVGATK